MASVMENPAMVGEGNTVSYITLLSILLPANPPATCIAEIAAITAIMMEITSKGIEPGLTPIAARTKTPYLSEPIHWSP